MVTRQENLCADAEKLYEKIFVKTAFYYEVITSEKIKEIFNNIVVEEGLEGVTYEDVANFPNLLTTSVCVDIQNHLVEMKKSKVKYSLVANPHSEAKRKFQEETEQEVLRFYLRKLAQALNITLRQFPKAFEKEVKIFNGAIRWENNLLNQNIYCLLGIVEQKPIAKGVN